MHAVQINKMKNIAFYITLLVCLACVHIKAQTDLNSLVRLQTIEDNYTVTAVNDTSFYHEVVFAGIDTVNFRSVNATLSLKTESGWQTQQTITLSKSDLETSPCEQTLCFYRRNKNEWVLYLGLQSLLTKHLIELHFNMANSNNINTNWSNEF